MPSIKDSLGADLSGYKPVDVPQLPVIPQMLNDNRQKANPFLRCPLPPFNSDPDTLRQFESGNNTPRIRVIPLPVQATAAAGAQRSLTIASSSASSTTAATVPSATTLALASAIFNAPALAPQAYYQSTLLMAKSFQLMALSVSVPCEVRLYGTFLAQSFDASRVEGDPVPAEVTSNIITCVTLDSAPYQWFWQNKIGANQDAPQTKNIYITVVNPSLTDAISGVNVALSYLPLET